MTPPWYGTEKLRFYAQPLQDLATSPHADMSDGLDWFDAYQEEAVIFALVVAL